MVVPVKPFFFPSVRSCHTQGVGYLVRSGIGDDIRLFGKTDAQKIFLVLYDHNNHPALFFAVCLRRHTGISGCSIMGNGKICAALDIEILIEKFTKEAVHERE